MKKTFLTILLSMVLILALGVTVFASAHDGLCSCGRSYAHEDSEEYMIYDCLGCGRNYTSCTCHTCWCGSDLTRTELENVTLVSCDGCGLPCEECICRDRSYYDALQGVKQGLTGEEIPNPNNGVLIALATLLPFGGFLGLYFTIYRRRSSTRNRRYKAPVLEQELDTIDKEPDAKKRYAFAKQKEESKRDGDTRILDREGKVLCFRKNELLADAVEEEWIRDTVNENLRTCRTMNRIGFAGSIETLDRLWDFKTKDFSADRQEISGETPAQSVVKWDTKEPAVALFEIVKPLNGREENLLHPASNTTRFTARIFEKEPLMNRKTDPSTEEQRRQTVEALLPGANADALLSLDRITGQTPTAPDGLPDEVSPKRMGDKNRFPGGMAQ
ncbi:MAG: hypothetical protein J6B86_06335 [Clostridia bacterium]|nr:hypothetical protein [Clostridia bacterium]